MRVQRQSHARPASRIAPADLQHTHNPHTLRKLTDDTTGTTTTSPRTTVNTNRPSPRPLIDHEIFYGHDWRSGSNLGPLQSETIKHLANATMDDPVTSSKFNHLAYATMDDPRFEHLRQRTTSPTIHKNRGEGSPPSRTKRKWFWTRKDQLTF
jgi:hypothetical protein